jgi:hypothetical protein|tara:strand:- start:154 stop:471 length:318 start_codon:yes stop_codon:yes gene_type:complete
MSDPTVTITPGEIRRKRPREFWEFGDAFIPKDARMVRTHDLSVDRNWRSQTVFCRRSVQKNGKPLGPWVYDVGNYSYRFDPEGEDLNNEAAANAALNLDARKVTP